MSKEEVIIGFEEQTGFRISKCDIATGKVVVNGIEITSVEDWEKVTKSLIKLQNNWNELNEFLEKEKERLVKECSNHYTDSFDKYHAVNEDIYDELIKVTDKMQELEGNNE